MRREKIFKVIRKRDGKLHMVMLNTEDYEGYKKFYKLNDRAMAEKLGFSKAYISRIVTGERAASSFFIQQYLKVTGLSFERAFKCNDLVPFQKENFEKYNGKKSYNEYSERGPKK